ncbi:hypothetical protein [Bradyrhizobium guangdongense]|uniref:Uncharacterized protein n=1 Tax=Bradyrhizobium guangdongense TaxID=1325090 RepID=A0A410UZP7_9BRAD|nr:hypothetical protein [Bradyrhizobium guangdongense]QAU36885.1 hypothetical protein X265_03605 [Bradyrhizobium guangdongense]QOZ57937.1 hypothetical protein XH86_03600 [Bradyrhizobium guangdongense]GGI30814.1 hypothetical protein GCM10010987_61310 [Bradyrhizobium guangdongense]
MADVEHISLRLTGVRPLLMHNGALADPLEQRSIDLAEFTGKRIKTKADHEIIAELEWYGGLWLHRSLPCLPEHVLESVFVDGARTKRKGRAATAGMEVSAPAMLDYEGPRDLPTLWKDPEFRKRAAVRIRESKTMRTRPRFPVWSATFTASYLPSLLDRDEVVSFFRIAGAVVGVGDWRPKFGKFTVDVVKEVPIP